MTGGGIYDEQVHAGLVYIVARSTVSPVANPAAARHMWEKRARKRCKGAFQELEITEYVDEALPSEAPGLRYLIATRKGYALCGWSPLTTEAALQTLDEGASVEPWSPVRTDGRSD